MIPNKYEKTYTNLKILGFIISAQFKVVHI